MMPRTARENVPAGCPVHVTVRLHRGLASLRRRAEGRVLLEAFAAGKRRFGFRLVHFSIQSDHLHLLVEAQERQSLSRGMKGLLVRVARALNKLWDRRGPVFSDRYHAHILRTPHAVRNALIYVLHNIKKHTRLRFKKALDEFSSARIFTGWKERVRAARSATRDAVTRDAVTNAGTALLKTGWLMLQGPLSVHDHPAVLLCDSPPP